MESIDSRVQHILREIPWIGEEELEKRLESEGYTIQFKGWILLNG